jgi:hypothetical protein
MNSKLVYRLCAAVLLAAIGAHRLISMHRPASVQAYHERIRAAAALGPRQINAWIGEDVPVPVQALSVLAPNAIISRRYVNVESGMTANFLIVHCSDAHDMAGHFPLRCYPAAGWARRATQPGDWMVGDRRMCGTEYEFYRGGSIEYRGAEQSIIVANCLLRPGGRVLRNMDEMTASIIGAGGQSSGAAQIQVSFDAGVPAEQRKRAVETLLKGYLPLIETILAPANQEPPSKSVGGTIAQSN